jgi:hypothetical protein
LRVTLGPKGRNVVLAKKWGAPTITNDGVSDRQGDRTRRSLRERIGAALVKEVAKKTDDVAGDGTTTATVLACVDGARGPARTSRPAPTRWSLKKWHRGGGRGRSRVASHEVSIDVDEQGPDRPGRVHLGQQRRRDRQA